MTQRERQEWLRWLATVDRQLPQNATDLQRSLYRAFLGGLDAARLIDREAERRSGRNLPMAWRR